MGHEVGGRGYPAAAFRAQMKFLKENFRVVPLSRMVEVVRAGLAPEGEVALTFDDGLRNHATVVYPALREFGLPATFFVSPGLIERSGWLSSYETRVRLNSLAPAGLRGVLGEIGAPPGVVGDVVNWMKTLGAADRRNVEHVVRERTPGFLPTAEERLRFDVMTWEELLSLSPELITIGSHTVNHAMLPGCPDEDLDQEIAESRRWLEKRLGRPVEYFCYPDGGYDDRSLALVRRHYSAAVTVRPGFARQGDDVYLLRRIPLPRSVAGLAWRLHCPGT